MEKKMAVSGTSKAEKLEREKARAAGGFKGSLFV